MTVPDILLALSITVMVVGLTLGLVDPVRRAVGVQTATAEIHQRARAGYARLERDLLEAGVSRTFRGPSGALPRAAVLPTRGVEQTTRDTNVTADAITIVRATGELPLLTTASAYPTPGLSVVTVGGVGCSASDQACGLRPDTAVMIFDDHGRSDFLLVTRVRGNLLTLSPMGEGQAPAYPVGSRIVPAQVRTYYYDAERAQLRSRSQRGADAPVLDNVVGLSFGYFGRPDLIQLDTGSSAAAFCTDNRIRSGVRPQIAQIALPLPILGDGPWCGGNASFDVDLLRVQRVRVELRLQTSRFEHRGLDRALFARPGETVSPAGSVPDVTARFDVAIRNPWHP